VSKPQIRVLFVVMILGVATLSEANTDELPRSIIAISSDRRPIQPIDWNGVRTSENKPEITIFNLDAVQSIQDQLSEGLPNDEKLARALVEQKIAEIGRSKLEDELRTAYLPLGTMMANGLDRYPVIIFDQQAVIYGITDLSVAINRYRQWLKDKQGATINE